MEKVSLLSKSLKVIDKSFSYNKEQFEALLTKRFNEAESIKITPTTDEIFEQNGIRYLLKVRQNSNLDLKPINIAPISKETKQTNDDIIDVFSDELITKDLIIDNDFLTKNEFKLVFNKFPIKRNHFLITTKLFEMQQTHLSLSQLTASLYINALIDGVCFFNGGPFSGASQIRKHLQFIPIKSFNSLNFGIFEQVDLFHKNKEGKENKENFFFIDHEVEDYYSVIIKKLTIPHKVIIFKEELNKINSLNIDEIGKEIFSLYQAQLKDLNLINQNKEKSNEIHDEQNYSLIITSKFMFLCKRSCNIVKLSLEDEERIIELNINSVGFLFTLLLKTEDVKERIKKFDLLDKVFNKL